MWETLAAVHSFLQNKINYCIKKSLDAYRDLTKQYFIIRDRSDVFFLKFTYSSLRSGTLPYILYKKGQSHKIFEFCK